jgi:hypothetical protein
LLTPVAASRALIDGSVLSDRTDLALRRGWTDIPEVDEELAVAVVVLLLSGRGIDAVVSAPVLGRVLIGELLDMMLVCIGQLNSEEPGLGTTGAGGTGLETDEVSDSVALKDVTSNDETVFNPPDGVIQGNFGTQGNRRLELPGTIWGIVCEHVVLVSIRPVVLVDVANVPVVVVLPRVGRPSEAKELGKGS